MPDPIHVHPYSHPLAGKVTGPTTADAEDHGGGIVRFLSYLNDPRPELGPRTKGCEEVEVVGRNQGSGQQCGKTGGSGSKRGNHHVIMMMTPPHEYMTR